jgi:TRAP-type mannitol/chloroaromatic compound transport system substrate-binding protein
MGGWFGKKVEDPDDIKDLRIRESGLPSKVWEKLFAIPN